MARTSDNADLLRPGWWTCRNGSLLANPLPSVSQLLVAMLAVGLLVLASCQEISDHIPPPSMGVCG